MRQQKLIRSTLMAFFCVISLSLQGCYSSKSQPIQTTTAIDCPKDSCKQEFALLPADKDISNPEDPTSMFLAKVRKQYPNAVALYAGVNSAKKEEELTLDIPYIDKPVILYLASYSAVKWNINPLADKDNSNKKTKVVAVVYGSYDDGTQIQGIAKEQTFNANKKLKHYKIKHDCRCSRGDIHYSGDTDVFQEMGKLQHQYGIQVINFTTDNYNNHLEFTNIDTPINFAQQATKKYKEQEKQKQQCRERVYPNYEKTYPQTKKSTQKMITFYGDNSTYPINTELNSSHIKKTQDFENHLYKFPIANNTWGDYLNPENKVPDVGYMAYYINADNVKKVVQKNKVITIGKKYERNKFLGIPSEKFNAYWVGVLRVAKAEFYNIQINQSWSGSRVSIDKHIILDEGRDDTRKQVFLPKGNYIIEVEYSNGDHSTDMQVMVTPLSKMKHPQDPTNFLADIKQKYPNVVALSAGVNEGKQQSVVLNIPKSVAPLVLYLGSSHTVKWQINNPHNSKIVGVVYGSYHKGSEVQGIAQDKVVNIGKDFASYTTNLVCHCLTNKNQCVIKDKALLDRSSIALRCYHCSRNQKTTEKKSKPMVTIYDKYGIKVVEYVGKYSTDYLGFQPFLGSKCR